MTVIKEQDRNKHNGDCPNLYYLPYPFRVLMWLIDRIIESLMNVGKKANQLRHAGTYALPLESMLSTMTLIGSELTDVSLRASAVEDVVGLCNPGG